MTCLKLGPGRWLELEVGKGSFEPGTYNELLEACFKELIVHSNSTGVFDRRQRILDHKFDVYVDVNLLQRDAH